MAKEGAVEKIAPGRLVNEILPSKIGRGEIKAKQALIHKADGVPVISGMEKVKKSEGSPRPEGRGFASSDFIISKSLISALKGGAFGSIEVRIERLAAKAVEDSFRRLTNDARAEITGEHKAIVFVPAEIMPKVIGKNGENIERMEKELGISIDVQEMREEQKGEEIVYDSETTKNTILIKLGAGMENREVHIHAGGKYLLSARAGEGGLIKMRKGNKIGSALGDALSAGEGVKVLLAHQK